MLPFSQDHEAQPERCTARCPIGDYRCHLNVDHPRLYHHAPCADGTLTWCDEIGVYDVLLHKTNGDVDAVGRP